MGSWIRRATSLLAILGGALFLVLPVTFLSGTVSLTYPLPSFRCPPGSLCPIFEFRPSPAGMVFSWTLYGVIGIILGFLVVGLGPRPRVGFAMGVAFSLGSMALLFLTVTGQILATFITTPPDVLLFPEISIVAMTAATLLYSYDFLRRGREIIKVVTS